MKRKKYFCPVCNNKIRAFNPISAEYFKTLDKGGFIHSPFQFETLNLLEYSCPKCGASDRNRLYALFLSSFIKDFKSDQIKVLDIAPDDNLRKWLKNKPQISYRSLDLFRKDVDDNCDITNMNIYNDKSYDIIICSHVLEHVEDDKKALCEIHRVLSDKGFAIIMAPVLLTLDHDFENPSFKTAIERVKFFGQEDHLRIYSKHGFLNKLQYAGFNVRELGSGFFGESIFLQNGISLRSVLYIARK
ncbi:MAG: hypothetical protein A2W93_10785 [Bacteroidetes bacterium GWF2_43_63]|nr:MAG: hypothetical protein A2W94_01675 [Bacteroidetes bacterium GWE2_42_42]OFY53012.1 MAG: hypothetical protein A2W93_10785 [Bacteroidetes bacterium GWF2_43_63]